MILAAGGQAFQAQGRRVRRRFPRPGLPSRDAFELLALLGWNPGGDREVMSVQEMISAFTLDRINPKEAAFDEKKPSG